MSAPRSRIYPRDARELLRDLAGAVVLGLGIGLLAWMTEPDEPLVPLLFASSLIGLWICLVLVGLLRLFAAPLGTLGRGGRLALLGLLFFVAGAGGWALGVLTLPWVSFGAYRSSLTGWRLPLAFAGTLGVAVGFAFYTHHRLKMRLEASYARIKEQEVAERELETARTIQQRLLPPEEMAGDGYRIAARNLPARQVAGDFYDCFRFADGALGVVVADVAGKGMGASLIMASVKAVLPLVAGPRRVAETLTALSARLRGELARREFVALALLRYEPETGDFELGNAGLPDPYRLTAGSPPAVLSVPGPRLPLGIDRRAVYRTLTGRLEPGERLLLLTDGPPEAAGSDGEPLGYERLAELVGETTGEPRAFLEALFARVAGTVGGKRTDDWTALVLERLAG